MQTPFVERRNPNAAVPLHRKVFDRRAFRDSTGRLRSPGLRSRGRYGAGIVVTEALHPRPEPLPRARKTVWAGAALFGAAVVVISLGLRSENDKIVSSAKSLKAEMSRKLAVSDDRALQREVCADLSSLDRMVHDLSSRALKHADLRGDGFSLVNEMQLLRAGCEGELDLPVREHLTMIHSLSSDLAVLAAHGGS